jgi:hypothetical protein
VPILNEYYKLIGPNGGFLKKTRTKNIAKNIAKNVTYNIKIICIYATIFWCRFFFKKGAL